MKNKKFVIIVLAVFMLLFGCGQLNQADAGTENEYISVSNELVGGGRVITIKNKETGCYFLMSQLSSGGGITQVFKEKNGVTVPKCDK